MKHLIVFYSRTGKNKRIAELIREKTGGDMEEIIDLKNRKGFLGLLSSGKDAFFKRLTRIKDPGYDPSQYDFLVIGTPVWAGSITPAIRTYLTENKDNIKGYFLFSVSGFGEKNRKISEIVKNMVGKNPIAELHISEKELKKNFFLEKMNDFINKIARYPNI